MFQLFEHLKNNWDVCDITQLTHSDETVDISESVETLVTSKTHRAKKGSSDMYPKWKAFYKERDMTKPSVASEPTHGTTHNYTRPKTKDHEHQSRKYPQVPTAPEIQILPKENNGSDKTTKLYFRTD